MHDTHCAELCEVPENEFSEFPLSAVLATHGKCDSHYASDRVLESERCSSPLQLPFANQEAVG